MNDLYKERYDHMLCPTCKRNYLLVKESFKKTDTLVEDILQELKEYIRIGTTYNIPMELDTVMSYVKEIKRLYEWERDYESK